MIDSSSDRDPLDRLAEEFVARLRAGERPSIEEYAARLPERADEILELFPALVEMEQLKPGSGEHTSDYAPGTVPSDPTRVGEFRILRRVGQGGMGIVYEAIQESLGRHVALKLLPADALLNPKRLERFRREAKSAARLHHTNIVPVFGTGDADGRHFYAMQFIQGHPLDAVIAEVRRLNKMPNARASSRGISQVAAATLTGRFPQPDALAVTATVTYAPVPDESADFEVAKAPVTHPPASESSTIPSISSGITDGGHAYFETVARLGAQVADALGYAHGQGVLHRDIKPANLLLDLSGTLWVTDFGLAKSNDMDDLTNTGDVIGTLRYMAPERFDGLGDQRADIFALGLTLYEMLTLQPAYSAENRAKLVEQAIAANPVRPRTINSSIPRDLETIVLKAIARDPAMRYMSANEMADDLRRFTEDRPIRARRASTMEQAVRWCRRNKAVASLSGAIFVLLVASTIAGTVMSLRLSNAVDRIQDERDKFFTADEARRREEEKSAGNWRAWMEQAAMGLESHEIGQRAKVRAALARAADIAVSPELKLTAAKSTLMSDLELVQEWDGWHDDTEQIVFDGSFRKFVRLDREGNLETARVAPAGEVVERRTRLAHRPVLSRLFLSPDARYLAYIYTPEKGNDRQALCVQDLANDGKVIIDNKPGFYWNGCSFHPSSTEIAVSSIDQTICRYSLPDGNLVKKHILPLNAGHIAHDPSGDRLAAACGYLLPILDLKTGTSRVLKRPDTGGWIGWHPDGRGIVQGSPTDVIRLIDSSTDRDIKSFAGGLNNREYFPQIGSNGTKLISSAVPSGVSVWDVASGRAIHSLAEQSLTPMHRPSDSCALITQSGSKIRVWRFQGGNSVLKLVPYGNSPGGRLTTSGTDESGRFLAVQLLDGQQIAIFDLLTGNESASMPVPMPSSSFANHIAGGDGWCLTSDKGMAHIALNWTTASSETVQVRPPVLTLPFQASSPLGAGASRDRRVIAVPDGHNAVIHHTHSPARTIRTGFQLDVRNASVSPDGSVVVTASASADGKSPTVCVWNATTGKLLKELTKSQNGGHTIRYSPDGSWLAVQLLDHWEIFSTQSWKKVHDYPNCESLVFSPDGRLVAFAVEMGLIQLCETATGRLVAEVAGPEPTMYCPFCFSADGGRLIATTRERDAMVVWDLRKTRTQLRELKLDWDWPELSPEQFTNNSVRIEVLGDQSTPIAKEPPATKTPTPARSVLRRDLRTWFTQPTTANQALDRGDAFSRFGLYDRALRDYTRATELDPGSHFAWAMLGNELIRREQWEKAVVVMTSSLRVAPDCFNCRFKRGWAYFQLGQFDPAAADFEACVPLVSQTYKGAVLLLRAIALEKGGQTAQAAGVHREAAKQTGGAAQSANALAWLYVSRIHPMQQLPSVSVLLAEKAVALDQKKSTYHNTFGVSLYRMGRYQEAINALEQSKKSGEADAFDDFFLAMCHHRLGHSSQARSLFDAAVDWQEKSRTTLPPPQVAELERFRVEAAGLLGLGGPQPNRSGQNLGQ